VSKLKGRPYFKASLYILAAGKFLIALLSTFLTTFLSLISMQDDSEIETDVSSDSFTGGVLNYRTGKLDDGTDPYGWYDTQ
jgi:hypothetical protein